jgi:hypothetical protein
MTRRIAAASATGISRGRFCEQPAAGNFEHQTTPISPVQDGASGPNQRLATAKARRR